MMRVNVRRTSVSKLPESLSHTLMMDDWFAAETTTHQDHVIAHVIGATVLGYFVHEEALHMLLDIGFIWTIYLDGQMVLLPQTVAINELETGTETRDQLK